jgi:hypothetical protein
MAAWRRMGILCINEEIQGPCQQCLWLEWNPSAKLCRNEWTCLCPKRSAGRQEAKTPAPSRPGAGPPEKR